MIHLLHNGVQLLLDGGLGIIHELEVAGLLAQADDLLGQGLAALAALGPHLGQGHIDAQLIALPLHQVQLGLGVGGEGVDGHHAGQAVHVLHVVHVLQQVGQALLQRLQVLLVQLGLGHAAVVLQRPHGGHDHHGGGLQAGLAALDVDELLCAQVGGEAGLRDCVVPQLQGHAGSDDGVAAVSDVGEGAAVDEGRGALQGLDQVGLQSVLQQGGHGALGLQVMGGDGLAVIGVGHDHPAQLLLQVGDAGGQAQHGHDLAGHGDLKAVLTGHALGLASQAVHDVAQLAVVHVHRALPGDLLDIDAQGIALLDMVVQHGGHQVVRRADGVEVAGEVEVDVLHGHHLGPAAAGRTALDAEHRAQGGLTQGDHGLLAQLPQAVRQPYGGGGLALARRGGGDGGDQDQLAVLSLGLVEQLVVHLCLVVAVHLQVLLVHARRGRDLPDVFHFTALCNFNVALDFHGNQSPSFMIYRGCL